MNVMLFVEEGRQLIGELDDLLRDLATQLVKPSSLTSYHCSIVRETGEIVDTLTAEAARSAIAADICRLDYPTNENDDTAEPSTPKRFVCSSIQVHKDLLPLLDRINITKASLQDWHARVLATQETKAEKQHFLRKVVLKKCDRPRLNLDACDAQLINTPFAIVRINWNINHCRPSRRLCVKDAINELKSMAKLADQDKAALLDTEIAAVQSLKHSTPVAACYGKGVKVLRYQATMLNSSNELSKINGHAANPIFYSGNHGQTPKFIPPTSSQKSRAGRPSTISEHSVSYSLPNWFFYKSAAKRPHPPAEKIRQRNARSPIPGLRLGQRRGSTCVIAGSTSISIRKYGLTNAWAMAVDKLIERKVILPEDRSKALAMCPASAPTTT
jgi:hypothetical protein